MRLLLGTSLLPGLLLFGAAAFVGCDDDPPGAGEDAARPRGPTVARASITIGEVQVRRANSEQWAPIAAGAELERGDLLRTGKGAFVSVKFKTGGGFELEENGLMIIRVAEVPATVEGGKATEQTVVALQSGTARGVFAEDEALLAPLVIEEEDGTRVSLAPSSNREETAVRISRTARGTEVAVSQGTAVLSTGGQRVSLSRGQAADVRKRGGLSAVVELLDYPPSLTPGIDARFEYAEGLSIPISWKPVEGAVSYQLQVARDLGFQNVVTNVAINATTTAFQPEEAGIYAWRVAARDAEGRLGEFGFARRIFAERDTPVDLLLTPESGASYAYDGQTPPPIQFAWQSSASATQYRLVISRTQDLLDAPVVDRALSEQRAEVGNLEPGEYWWGVYLSGAQPVPVFNAPRKLVVVKSARVVFETPKSISKWGKKKGK